VEIGEPRDAVLWGQPAALRRLATWLLRAADDADHLPEFPDAYWPDCEDGE